MWVSDAPLTQLLCKGSANGGNGGAAAKHEQIGPVQQGLGNAAASAFPVQVHQL